MAGGVPAFDVCEILKRRWDARHRSLPGLFICRGFELCTLGCTSPFVFTEFFSLVCRLRDSNPRPTVYKTVALPLC
jgi:hypothetical protein